MARTKTVADSGKAETKAAGKKSGTLTTTGGLDELSALVASTKELEDAERAKTGGQSVYIKLLSNGCGELDSNNPAYIKGARALDYVVTSKKLVVSDKKQAVDATILGMFKLYAEKSKKESENEMAKTIRYWIADDAVQYPTRQGSNFERALPNGNILIPIHWVFLYLHNYPEIEGGKIQFQSVGNSIYMEIAKRIKAESSVCTELRFRITSQSQYNETYKKTYHYPNFEIVGRNYKLTDDGKVMKSKDSDIDKETLKEILTRSDQLHKDFAACKIVVRQTMLPPSTSAPALAAGYVDHEEDANLSF